MRVQALEDARRKAKQKAELERWAEGEANRLAAIGARQNAAELQTQRLEAQREADRQNKEDEERARTIAPKAAVPAAAITPAGRAILPPTPPAPPPHKRPPANVSMDEVRKKVTAQIRKALPAIAAAQAARENGKSSA